MKTAGFIEVIRKLLLEYKLTPEELKRSLGVPLEVSRKVLAGEPV